VPTSPISRARLQGDLPKKSDKNRAMSDSIRALNLYGSSQVEADALDYAGLVGQVSLSGVTSTASTPVLSAFRERPAHLARTHAGGGLQLGRVGCAP